VLREQRPDPRFLVSRAGGDYVLAAPATGLAPATWSVQSGDALVLRISARGLMFLVK
jgi:hypothetical protein